MPIQYRCHECDQLLSIATRMAGREVPCPRCRTITIVPQPASQPAEPPPEDFFAPLDETAETPPVEEETPPEEKRTAPQVPAWFRRKPSAPETTPEPSPPLEEESALEETFESDAESLLADEVLAPPLDDDEEDELDATPQSQLWSDDEPPTGSVPTDAEADSAGFQSRRAAIASDDLDLTPMVDVTFLLLIFFMITASFSLQKTIEVPAPQPDNKGASSMLTLEDLQDNTIFVRIDQKNVIYIDDTPVSDPEQLAELLAQTRAKSQRNEVAIDANPEALHETVVLVIDAATSAEMEKVRLVSRTSSLQ